MKINLSLNDEFLELLLNLSNQGCFVECYENIMKIELALDTYLWNLLRENLELKSLKNGNK